MTQRISRVSIEWMLTSTRPSDDGGDTVEAVAGSLTFDAVTAQTRDITAELPEHPVEDSVDITDHVIPKPNRVSFEAHISSAVFDLEVSNGASRRSIDDARVIGSDDPGDRAEESLAILQDLSDHGTEVDVLGLPYGDLEGYQIASISMTQSQGIGRKLVPTIEVRQRNTVSLSEVSAPAPRVERTRNQTQRGQQRTSDDEDDGINRTMARALLDAVIGGQDTGEE